MPPQKTVHMGRKPKAGASTRGHGRRRDRSQTAGTSRRAKDSATPAKEAVNRPLMLKLKMSLGSDQQNTVYPAVIDFDQASEQHAEEEEEDVLLVAVPIESTRRSGRETKQPRYDDCTYSSEMEGQLTTPVSKAKDKEYMSSPPTLLTLEQQEEHPTPRKHGCARKPNFQPSLGTVNEDFTASDTIQASSLNQVNRSDVHTFKADGEIHQILELLNRSSKVNIDLPTLVHATIQGAEKPYTARYLTQLYILAYNDKQWNVCDLVADTWIRAFHALRRLDAKRLNKEHMTWRPNPTRRMKHHKGFETGTPKYSATLRVEDPSMDPNVTHFRSDLLEMLYSNTHYKCGARLLWADAMALCGSKLEASMRKDRRQWHADLVFDVMCTSLRMARRKLTLKIEESTEGVWCKRYHEHEKHGLPCYRKLAYEKKVRGEDLSDEDEPGVDEQEEDDIMAQMIEAELKKDEKRGLEDDEVEMGQAKRMRIGDQEREVLDVDAEGESDDE